MLISARNVVYSQRTLRTVSLDLAFGAVLNSVRRCHPARSSYAQARAAVERVEGIEVLQADDSLLILSVAEASRKLPAIFAALAAAGADVHGTTLTQPSLESLFIRLTGKELRE